MTRSLWERISRIYHAAEALPCDARASFVARECNGDSSLEECLNSMMAHADAADTLLDGPMLSTERLMEFASYELRTFQPGEIVCRKFRVERFIAEGGMGEVYAAVDLHSEERVALKTLRPALALSKLEGMLRSEIQIALRVTHHNVARVHALDWHEFGDGEDRPRVAVISMELLEGESLSERLARTGSMKEREALPIAQQIARGLDHAHAAGVVHRDLKPGNVMIEGEDGAMRAAITDFGLARLQQEASPDGDTIIDFRIEGTAAYIAPEQLIRRNATPAADIYAFGVMLFEMATGRLPFSGANAEQTARKRLTERAPAARSFARDLDPRWNRAIARCLELDSKLRPKSAGAVIAMLRSPARQVRRFATAVAVSAAFAAIAWVRLQPPPLKQRAVEAYKRGENFLNGRNRDDLQNAVREFGEAVRIEKRYADAWVGLAEAYSAMGNFALMPAQDAAGKSEDAAEHALALDRHSGRARGILGYIRSLDVHHWKEAGPLLRRAVDDAPDDAKVRLWYGAFLGKAGRSVAALEQLRTGLEIDPSSAALNQQFAIELLRAREFPEFETQARELVRLQSREPIAHGALARALTRIGDWEGAERECGLMEIFGDRAGAQTMRAALAAARGDIRSARDAADELRRYWEAHSFDSNILASLYAQCGKRIEAASVLQAGFKRGDSSVLGAPTNPTMDRLLDEPGYQTFLHEIGWPPDEVALPLPAHWKLL